MRASNKKGFKKKNLIMFFSAYKFRCKVFVIRTFSFNSNNYGMFDTKIKHLN